MRSGKIKWMGFSQKLFAPFLISFALSVPQTQAQDLRDPQFMARARPAFANIFNLDYRQAEQTFLLLQKDYPDHPAPPLYLATIVWLEELMRRQDLDLDRFASPAYFMSKNNQDTMDPARRKTFLDNIEKSQWLARKRLDTNPADKDAQYFLASAYGIMGSFTFTIDRNLRGAFGYGKKAYQIDRQLIQADPQYYDAYMTVGLYDYIVGSLPWYIRWMGTVLGFQGNKERGLRYLSLAIEKGQYDSDDSQVIITVALFREGRYAEALQRAEHLRNSFLRNYLLQLNVAQILERMERTDQAVAAYQQVVKLAEEKSPNYDRLPLNTFRYLVGRKFFQLGRRQLASEEFRKAIDDPRTPNREKALSHLNLGEIFDLEGRRTDAVRQYQTVLQLQDYDHSHNAANNNLKKPFG
jgi:tetratricopeptide (TPR) repeat protein